MSTYQPQPGVFAGRPPCANCGAAYRLHHDSNLTTGERYCPEAYRPGTLEVAHRELEAAEASGDQARVFVARGNLQRLTFDPVGIEAEALLRADRLAGATTGPTQHQPGGAAELGPERRNALVPEVAYFTITLVVPLAADLDEVTGITEAQAELWATAVEEATGLELIDKLVYDPQHPFDGTDPSTCQCVGPPGWHCPGETSEHWAEHLDDPRSTCGHCGGQPDEPAS